jgi:hippocalcin-like protein 1
MVGSSTESGVLDDPQQRTAEIFAKMDSNGDGILSKDEFIRGCMEDDNLCQMLTNNQEV